MTGWFKDNNKGKFKKFLIYSNPLGWCMALGILTAIAISKTKDNVKESYEILTDGEIDG